MTHTNVKMSGQPVLMVLYTNDAMEVRYSDGARLHVLPCGTSFSYHTSQEAHPVHGMTSIQQRCCFVTSDYREMVLSALDFRNRFAERPYLCEEMMEKDQVVNLYASINNIAWPKHQDPQRCERLADGSVRITSEDEFASLVLSPHRKDFTVCYLSLLSQEKTKERTQTRKNKFSVQNSQANVDSAEQHNLSSESKKSDTSDEVVNIMQDRPRHVEGVAKVCRGVQQEREDLNISPITQASCTGSPGAISNNSGSPITPRNAVTDNEAKFRPFSTPTEDLEDGAPECTPYGDTAVFQNYGRKGAQHVDPLQKRLHDDGSYIAYHDDKGHRINNDHRKSQALAKHADSSGHSGRKALSDRNRGWENSARNGSASSERYPGDVRYGYGAGVGVGDSRGKENDTIVSGSSEGSGGGAKVRRQYCWVTRHISCDECPLTWSYPLKLCRELAEKGNQSSDKDATVETKNTCSEGKLRKLRKEKCAFSGVPHPLLRNCPGQHLHKMQLKKVYSDGKDPLEDPTSLSQGPLKILLIDGIVYRLVRLANLRGVEVYPGDGSVLVSQGMSAHFFLHIIPREGGKLEERTYSMKSKPQTPAGSPYSIKTLLNRAHRFLAHIRQEDNMASATFGLCCWKHEEMQLVEPLSTSLLEECSIPGYGKFTAMSNGQVRVVFKDRTSLDMTWDFSSRVGTCLDHSGEGHMAQSQMVLAGKKSGTCRLLLPNGQYVMVEMDQPGAYKRYIDAATEWAEWVNSSPQQRQVFYKERGDKTGNLSVERELQKIHCFNYIVDNTVLKKDGQSDVRVPGEGSTLTGKPGPSILRKTDPIKQRTKCEENHLSVGTKTVHIHSPTSTDKISNHSNISDINSIVGLPRSSTYSIGQMHYANSVAPPTEVRLQPIGQTSVCSYSPNSRSTLSSLEGFNAVREALLRTSSVIKDIDSILDKR